MAKNKIKNSWQINYTVVDSEVVLTKVAKENDKVKILHMPLTTECPPTNRSKLEGSLSVQNLTLSTYITEERCRR